MKLEHTQKKEANRYFSKSSTGFANSLERKAMNKIVYTKEKKHDHKGFTKSKPVRRKRIRQTVKNK